MNKSTNDIFTSIKTVLSKPAYALMTLFVFSLVLTLSIWLPNLHLITNTIHSDTITIQEKTSLLLSLLEGIQTNFTPLSRLIVISLSLLFGINISMFIFYLRRRISSESKAGVSLGGIIFGLLGVGCASCGSIVLSTIFGLSVASGFLRILPFRGQEFGLVGIAFILYSIILLSQKISNPLMCKVNLKGKNER